MIERMSSGQMSRTYLSDLRGIYSRLADAQQQITTGRTMLKPSDDPVGISIALGLRRDQAATDAWSRNIDDSLTWLDTTDRALGQALEVVQQAAEMAVQGGNGALPTDARALIANAIRGLKGQFAEVGNSTLGGRHLFAGTGTDTAPFDSTTGALNLPVNTELLTREIAQGSLVSINTTADRLAGPGGATPDIFTVLDGLANAVQSGNSAGIGTAMADLDAHMVNINALRGEVGAKVNRLELTADRFASQRVATAEQQGNLEGADIAKAMISFTERQNVYSAALAVGARISQQSLMDFLR